MISMYKNEFVATIYGWFQDNSDYNSESDFGYVNRNFFGVSKRDLLDNLLDSLEINIECSMLTNDEEILKGLYSNVHKLKETIFSLFEF